MKKAERVSRSFWIPVCLLSMALLHCSAPSRDSVRILFIGIDAMDWEMVDRLIGEGMLPNTSRLVRDGASARMDTGIRKGVPERGSAVYWTSIATGQESEKHGIRGFVYRDAQTGERVPYTSDMRRTKAFWNILSENDISVGVVGWFFSWPVEKVNGFMISSYFSLKQPTLKGTVYEATPDMVFPDTLQDEVDGCIQDAEEKDRRDIKKIIRPSALDTGYKIIDETKWSFLSDEIFAEVGIHLYSEFEPRVFAVYLNGIDVVGHRYTTPNDVNQAKIDSVFGPVQRSYYLYIDEILGRFIRLADPNTLVIVASDHGLMKGEHTNNGVFIMSGPWIREGVRIERPIHLTDICPTLLYLLDLPVARDFDGRVFAEAISEAYLREHEVRLIDSYGERKVEGGYPRRSEFDELIVERLKSLGYLQ